MNYISFFVTIYHNSCCLGVFGYNPHKYANACALLCVSMQAWWASHLCCSLQAIRTGWVHPNLNLENPENIVVSSFSDARFQCHLFYSTTKGARYGRAKSTWIYKLNGLQFQTSTQYVSNMNVSMLILIQDVGVLVGPQKERCEVNVALSNSFGFGGHNSSILFAPFKWTWPTNYHLRPTASYI